MSEAQLQHVRCARARARKSIEKTAVSASKIEPGRSKTTPERAKVDVGRPSLSGKTHPERARTSGAHFFFASRARRAQRRAKRSPSEERTRAAKPETRYENSRMDVELFVKTTYSGGSIRNSGSSSSGSSSCSSVYVLTISFDPEYKIFHMVMDCFELFPQPQVRKSSVKLKPIIELKAASVKVF